MARAGVTYHHLPLAIDCGIFSGVSYTRAFCFKGSPLPIIRTSLLAYDLCGNKGGMRLYSTNNCIDVHSDDKNETIFQAHISEKELQEEEKEGS